MLWFITLFAVLVQAQYPAWKVTKVFAGPGCNGNPVTEFGVPTLIPACYDEVGNSTCTVAANDTSSLINLPGSYQITQCRDFMPYIATSYRSLHGVLGTGNCGEFFEGYGWLAGCNRIVSNSSFQSFRPACFSNLTVIWGFTDENCISGKGVFLSINVAPLDRISSPICRKDQMDNQSSWLLTCPNIEVFGAATKLMPSIALLLALVTLFVGVR